MVRAADFRDFLGVRLGSFAQAVDFDQQHRSAVERKAGVNVGFDGAERPAIEHFAGGWRDAASRDFDDRFGGVVDAIENREQSFHGFRQARKLHGNFRDESERAFRADEKAGQIVAGRIECLLPMRTISPSAERVRGRGHDWW